ncbi:MAG: hypothetical protein RLZZ203_1792 [Cyanobacteriota bacterium]
MPSSNLPLNQYHLYQFLRHSCIVDRAAVKIFFWPQNNARLDWVLVYVFQFLVGDFVCAQFNRVVVLLPKLIPCIVAVIFTCPLKQPNQPLLSALLWVGFDGLDYLHRCKLLDVSDDALQAFFTVPAYDHVHMATHDAIGTDLKPLVFLAIA